jgi:hypothetical protein
MRVLILIALCCFGVRAQEKATVYIYEPPHKTMIGRVAPLIFCDEKPLAEIPGGRFFIAKLDSGVHTFRSKDRKKGGVEIDLKSAATYYLKVRLDADGYFLRYAGIELVPEANGRYDIKQLKPIDKKDVKDETRVSLSP